MKRRRFIKYSALGSVAAGLLSKGIAHAAPRRKVTAQKKRILVLVELQGGNDGLNTLIPFRDPLYYHLRPTLAIPKQSTLPISDSLAFHPSLRSLQRYWQANQIACLQGVGYPRSNRSHFRSIDIWNTASNYNQNIKEGWISNLLGVHHDIAGLVVNSQLGPLAGYQSSSIRINDIETLINSNQPMQARSTNTRNNSLAHLLKTERVIAESTEYLKKHLRKAKDESHRFPRHEFGREFASIARLINSGIDIPSYKLTLSSFDTHTLQARPHADLLKLLADSFHAFAQTMQRHQRWNDVLVMTYSEFGRQVAENGNQGTDHGEASVQFVMGGKVKGGIYGKNPDLNQLNKNALPHRIDFRSVYGTVASRWWGLRNPWNRPLIPFI
ncbi:MAG: DUF1501 domain-containing protein [Cocleimonas sp.]|nr:DUF1501 domain-containing protein [Cocleimonas sp.]